MSYVTRFGTRIAVVVVGALLVTTACAQENSRERTAPKGEGFYRAPDDVSDLGPGELIWARDYDGPHAIDGAKNSLILYTQKAHDSEQLVGVSGIVSIPEGKAPEGGWPVVSWAHGSTGLADRCAPSRDLANSGHALPNELFIEAWIDKGYAVVRSDFEGLGTPGPHPYLIGPSAGRSVLGIVTAAQDLDPDVGSDVVLVGHSQGGHAALWGASMADTVRDVNIKGVVAFAPPTHLSGALDAVLGGMADAPSGIIAVVLRGLEIGHPNDVDPEAVLLPTGFEPYSRIDDACWGEIFGPNYFGNVSIEEFGDHAKDLTLFKGKLNANDPSFRRYAMPIFLAQGERDTTIPSIMTNFLAEEVEGNGHDVTYMIYPKADHNSVLAESQLAAHEFIDRAFAKN